MPKPLDFCFRAGNYLYKRAFPVYRPLYYFYKAICDRRERDLIKLLVHKGDVVVDVGANIGVYSRFLSHRVRSAGKVHSFEPAPDNFKRLSEALSGYSNIRLNNVAVGKQTGEIPLYLSDELNVDHRAYSIPGVTRHSVVVHSTSLDVYFTSSSRVDFIKMDVQGYELSVLRGASRLLRENPQIAILMELWPYGLEQAGESAEALFQFLDNHALIASSFRGNRLVPYEPNYLSRGEHDYFNIVLTHRDRTLAELK